MNHLIAFHLANAMLMVIGIAVVMQLIIIAGMALFVLKCYHKPTGDVVLVRTGRGGPRVCFVGGTLSYPVLHKLHRVHSGLILLKHPETGGDWPVKLVADETHAISAMQSFGDRPVQDIQAALQAIVDQHENDAERLRNSLASVGYAPVA